MKPNLAVFFVVAGFGLIWLTALAVVFWLANKLADEFGFGCAAFLIAAFAILSFAVLIAANVQP